MTIPLPLFSGSATRRTPILIVILLDQSGSMSELVIGMNCSKAEYATTAVNEVLYTMIDRTAVDLETGDHKKVAYVSVLGYSDEVYPLLKRGRKNPR